MSKIPIVLMGLGLALIPIHRVSNAFWAIGFALVLFAVVLIIVTRLREHKLTLGSRYVYIPLAIIVVSMLIAQGDWSSKLIGIALFATYIACVNLKGELKLLVPAVIIGCISIIVCNLLEGTRTGGIYSLTNYNLAVGAIIMGTVLVKSRYQWILVTVVLVGLLFTGAEEALVALAILVIAVLVRRDWNRKILIPVGMVVLVATVSAPSGALQLFWSNTQAKVDTVMQTENSLVAQANGVWGTITTERLDAWERAVTDIKPLGHGYEPFYVRYDAAHNVLLRILYEVGPLAVAAFCFVMIYALIKTKRKYIIVALIALSLFDHFLWTQLCVYTFVAIGIAMRLDGETDLIFRKNE